MIRREMGITSHRGGNNGSEGAAIPGGAEGMKINIIYAREWIGLYVDGRLALEGCGLFPADVVKVINPTATIRVVTIPGHELDDNFSGNFSEDFVEVEPFIGNVREI